MKPLQLGMKVTEILGKPVKMFFGSDERGFATLTGASIITYASGFPDAGIIIAVYSTLFGFSGMQKYSTNSNNENDSPFDEEKMMDIMGQAGEALDEIQDQDEEEDE